MARAEHGGHTRTDQPGRPAGAARSSSGLRAARLRRPLSVQVARAALVQRSLLPDVDVPVGAFRIASLYWPCEMLGGDFYDLARRQDGGVLLLADVMGHGVEAALITMLVKAAFQEAAASTSDPGELLAEMRAHLYRTVPPDRTFVATMIVRLDLHDSSLQLANAGLPHPFVLRGGARRLDEVSLDGRPLGLCDALGTNGYPATRVTLMPGDVLLIASDGIGSVKDARGDYFEDRRLRQALVNLIGRGGRDVIDGLGTEAVDFSHGRRLPDDVNLIAIWPGPESSASNERADTAVCPCQN